MSAIPCTLVTGALGSGKTTLIRAAMEAPKMAGTALIVNEFGEVGLDHLLLSSAVETTLLMDNGCLCCSLRGDIIDTVLSLFGAVERGEAPPFDRILIETTGLADPVPILRDLTTAPVLKGKVLLSSVVTCVDGLIGGAELSSNPVAMTQVAQADTCILTKADVADPLKLEGLRERLATINPIMTIHAGRQGAIPTHILLEENTAISRTISAPTAAEHGHNTHDHSADSPHVGVDSWSKLLDQPLPWALICDWLDLVYSLHAGRMLRMKGILWIEEQSQPLLVQAVGPVVTPLASLDEWSGQPQSRLVLIGKGISWQAFESSFTQHVLKQCS